MVAFSSVSCTVNVAVVVSVAVVVGAGVMVADCVRATSHTTWICDAVHVSCACGDALAMTEEHSWVSCVCSTNVLHAKAAVVTLTECPLKKVKAVHENSCKKFRHLVQSNLCVLKMMAQIPSL